MQVRLIDSLGTVMLSLPIRYDTFFTWINYSDCGKPCNDQKYRFQPKNLPITKESGWLWKGDPKDSVDRFTISHSGYFPFHNGDSTYAIGWYKNWKFRLTSDSIKSHLVFDTLEKINGRYISIFASQSSDTIQSQSVLAVTTIKGNAIRFQFELLTRKNDSTSKNFIKNAINFIQTIHISNGM